MDLANDLFTITVAADGPDDAALLKAIDKTGFKSKLRKGSVPVKKGTAPKVDPAKFPTLVKTALAQAKKEGKLVLVDFTATWCGPCKRMIKVTFTEPKVAAELAKHFVLLKVDTDKHPEVSRHFEVKGIPDARILTASGTQLTRIIGFRPPAKFLPILQDARKRATAATKKADSGLVHVTLSIAGMT